MNTNTSFIVSLLLATSAVVLTSFTIRSAGENNRVYASRTATLRELGAMRDEAARMNSGLKLIEQSTVEPADIESAARKILPDAVITVTQHPELPLLSGWNLRPVEIKSDQISAADAGRLIEYLENQLPPWRLAEFDYTAESTNSGRIAMTVQTVVRSTR